MEQRALFGQASEGAAYLESPLRLPPNRSPFVQLRLDVLFTAPTLAELGELASLLELEGYTFKVRYLKSGQRQTYEGEREAERRIGARIRGIAEMREPEVTLGLLARQDDWVLGICRISEPVWLAHKEKPNNYSTGLTTVVARALANIAVPNPEGKRVIDPCCGMGNVLIEALSMGIDIVGRDINPVAIRGARSNLRHFGYEDTAIVKIGDLNELDGEYDAAIVDLPYNLCSVLPAVERRRMLDNVRRISTRTVIVSTEPLEQDMTEAGLIVTDRCTVSKGHFVRKVWVVNRER
ncbi:methyltransferase domain-containing protein [Paenibacillus sp. MBLB2552]|uniref:Methyltransferase domain-containing protein n=1 Tax=Paenibacillus mellifer TaxID=2937794 RepID=A0A9X1XUN2_9BACL|nr:methyltransferase domain-containing protein [Paenibacillus mellifer]MCK8485895.1 methyltransferase domain-containing protein [Paenibacillus mellifer]